MSDELKMVGFDTVMREVAKAKAEWLDRATLPAVGAHIAWSMHDRGGCTDALSSAHRVGEPKKGAPYTTCGMPIPDPLLWLSLSPALIEKGLLPCGFCEAVVSGIAQEAA